MGESKTVTAAIAVRYQQAARRDKQNILDELCVTTGWHRDHVRKALRSARQRHINRPTRPTPVKYDQEVVTALVYCWSVLGMPASKRLAPVLGEVVTALRRFGELDVSDDTAALLAGMSPATIDRRLAPERRKQRLDRRGRITSDPLFTVRPASRTCTEWDGTAPGFVEVRLVPHGRSGVAGEHAWTLSIVDASTGWTERRSVCDRTRASVLAALDHIAITMPFPIRCVGNDRGGEFIDELLHDWCIQHRITFTRSRSVDNPGCDDGQQNWAAIRPLAGYHRYGTVAEVRVLNRIWKLQSILANYFYPHQRLVSKVHTGTRVSKKYETAATPYRRAEAHRNVSVEDKAILADTYAAINPAAVQREIQALFSELLTVAAPGRQGAATRAS